MAVAAIAAAGCLAGLLGLRAPESESRSALTLANIEALSSNEILNDCDAICKEDPNYACVLHYSWGDKYCVRKSQRN